MSFVYKCWVLCKDVVGLWLLREYCWGMCVVKFDCINS